MLQASSTTNGGGTVAHVTAAAPGPAASPAHSLATPAVHGAEAAGAEVPTSVRAPRQKKAPSAKAMRLSRAEGKGEGQARPGVGAGALSRRARGGARHGNRAGMAAPAPAGMPVPIESRVAASVVARTKTAPRAAKPAQKAGPTQAQAQTIPSKHTFRPTFAFSRVAH